MKNKTQKRYPFLYILLIIVLGLAFFLRVYRVNEILGFYYDQGRDALVIWDLWNKGKFFLIGPTTGIAGIFRGPFYYYLIAPFYLIGQGNPIYPSMFLAFLSVVALGLLYHLGLKIQDRITGFIALILASFSFYMVFAARWLSNPTPTLFLSVLLLLSMTLIVEGKKWAWILASFVAGSALFHFGSSGELFYFLAITIFAIWQYKNLPKGKILMFTILSFLITVVPLIIFDIKHDGILRANIKKFVISEKSFSPEVTKKILNDRFELYYDVFTNKIFHERKEREIFILGVLGLAFLGFLPSFIKNKKVVPLLLLFASPLVGFLFFIGNYGIIYDYYFTGYYLIFILVVALVLGKAWKFKLGKLFVIVFLYLFFVSNLPVIRYKLEDRIDRPEVIYFGNQKQAIDWIYKDFQGKDFNVDVYVPPVIPYAYDYLFRWYGGRIHGKEPSTVKVPLLYTLYESDSPHPERLGAWLDRQDGIGKVQNKASFGGITVERRIRY